MQNHLIGPSVRGVATNGTRLGPDEFPALNIDHYRAAVSLIDTNTPTGSWRAPRFQCHRLGSTKFYQRTGPTPLVVTPWKLLIEMMGEPRWFQEGSTGSLNTGRAVDVIKLAAEKSGWGKTLPAGRGMGIAFHFSHAGHVAEVAEVSVDGNNKSHHPQSYRRSGYRPRHQYERRIETGAGRRARRHQHSGRP